MDEGEKKDGGGEEVGEDEDPADIVSSSAPLIIEEDTTATTAITTPTPSPPQRHLDSAAQDEIPDLPTVDDVVADIKQREEEEKGEELEHDEKEKESEAQEDRHATAVTSNEEAKESTPKKLCGFIGKTGKPCQRTAACPFHTHIKVLSKLMTPSR